MERPALIGFRNGQPASRTFSDGEFDQRLVRLRRLMADLRVDVALFTSYQNINYYTDFLYCSFGRDFGLFVDDGRAVTISANVDGGQPWRRTVGGQNRVYTDWQRDNFYRAVAELVPAGSVVGIEYDQVDLQMRGKLEAALPSCKFVDVSESVMRLRIIKSAEEIDHITAMAAVADLGGKAAVEAIGEGVGEHEVALAATGAMVQAIAARWPDAELMDTWTWLQSGINTDGAHNPVTSRRLAKGDILSLNCFPMVAGYYVALERTLFLDHASDDHLRLWQVNCRVHDEGKKLLVPGACCKDVALALNEIYAEHDLLQYRTFGYGHSFGVLCHYYGREAGLELREDIETVLEPGMVLSMEPMITVPEGLPGAGGYREHDVLVITGTGNTNITGFPYGPAHNIVPA